MSEVPVAMLELSEPPHCCHEKMHQDEHLWYAKWTCEIEVDSHSTSPSFLRAVFLHHCPVRREYEIASVWLPEDQRDRIEIVSSRYEFANRRRDHPD